MLVIRNFMNILNANDRNISMTEVLLCLNYYYIYEQV